MSQEWTLQPGFLGSLILLGTHLVRTIKLYIELETFMGVEQKTAPGTKPRISRVVSN